MKLAIIAAILVANLATTIAVPGPLRARGLEQDIVQVYGRAGPDRMTGPTKPKSVLKNPEDHVVVNGRYAAHDPEHFPVLPEQKYPLPVAGPSVKDTSQQRPDKDSSRSFTSKTVEKKNTGKLPNNTASSRPFKLASRLSLKQTGVHFRKDDLKRVEEKSMSPPSQKKVRRLSPEEKKARLDAIKEFNENT